MKLAEENERGRGAGWGSLRVWKKVGDGERKKCRERERDER